MIAALADAGRRARPRRLPRRRRSPAPSSSGRDLRDDDGRLLRTYKDGEARLAAYLEDYAYLVEALLTLYEATFEVRWFDAARETADLMIELLRRPRARRLLHHGPRPRAPDRPPQGRRRPPDPVGQLLRRLRAAAARRADRRARVRAPRRGRASAPPPRRRAPPAGASPTCFARWTSTSPRSRRWRWSPRRDGDGPRASSPRPSARASARTWCSRAAPRAPSAPS